MRPKAWIGRAAVAVFLLTSLCAGALALPHDEGLDDFACAPVFVSHDESAHYIGDASSSSTEDAQHCFLCHSLRSFCSVYEKYEQRDDPAHTEHPHAASVAVVGRLEWSLTPGRAPPA
jgi:hypothetical protein